MSAGPVRARITATAPLRVRVDGEDAPLGYTPDDFVGGLAIGDLVLLTKVGAAYAVTHRLGGGGKPIGTIWTTITSDDPNDLFRGTWVSWGSGRIPVGVDTGQTEFNTVEKTGGGKTHAHPLSDAGHGRIFQSLARFVSTAWTATHAVNLTVGSADSSTASFGIGLGGSTDTGSTLPPYVTCYMWKRTA